MQGQGTAAVAASSGPLTGDALVLHVARRLTFGPTPALLAEIRSLGVDAWIERQLQPNRIGDTALEPLLRPLTDLQAAASQLRLLHYVGEGALSDLRLAAVVRAAASRRQLQQVMVDLWHDHLVASSAKAPVRWHLPAYDRRVIRPHALGRYTDLLRAATKAGAMLEYLDTTASSQPTVNENHARELLELHTVGRAIDFSELDVASAARILSGWTLEQTNLGVVFDPQRHDNAAASVLGWRTPGRAGPSAVGDLDGMLQHLATHPATAQRIATLLAQRFISDEPPQDVVDSTAAAFLASGTDIAATLRHLFATAAFRRGGSPLVRRPFDLLGAQLRATDARLEIPGVVGRVAPVSSLTDDIPVVDDLVNDIVDPLLDATTLIDPLVDPMVGWALDPRPIGNTTDGLLRHSGQRLFAAPDPSGHPLRGNQWLTGDALLRRWTFAAELAHGATPGISVDAATLAARASTAGAAVDALAQRCFGTAAAPGTRAGALSLMGLAPDDPIDSPGRYQLGLGFLLAAPEMQTR